MSSRAERAGGEIARDDRQTAAYHRQYARAATAGARRLGAALAVSEGVTLISDGPLEALLRPVRRVRCGRPPWTAPQWAWSEEEEQHIAAVAPLDIKGRIGRVSAGRLSPRALQKGHSVDKHVKFLEDNGFNAVRLPLGHWASTKRGGGACGSYRNHRTLDVLDSVIAALRRAGIFVMLDMHNPVHPKHGSTLVRLRARLVEWVDPDEDDEQQLFGAWTILAERYCAEPHVIAADLFNEPSDATWGTRARHRLLHRLAECCSRSWQPRARHLPRWLIVVAGVANKGGQCKDSASKPIAGKNLSGHATRPVELSDPSSSCCRPTSTVTRTTGATTVTRTTGPTSGTRIRRRGGDGHRRPHR